MKKIFLTISLFIAIAIFFSPIVVLANTSNVTGEMTRNISSSISNSVESNPYTATKTSVSGYTTFLGMTSTGWTWLIVGIFGVAIIALIWFYGKQHEDTSKDNN